MTEHGWEGWRGRLASEIGTLGEVEFVVFDHEGPPEEQRWTESRGVLGRRKAQPIPSGFLAQFAGQGQGLVLGVLAGASLVGGHLELTEEQDRQIRELGWKAPGDPGHYEPYAPDYTVTEWPRSAAEELARITVRALAVQGASPDPPWTLRRGS